MYQNIDNGDLAGMLGEEVADANLSLPKAGPDQPETITVDTHTQQLCAVRLTFIRHRYKRGKTTYRIWGSQPRHPLAAWNIPLGLSLHVREQWGCALNSPALHENQLSHFRLSPGL